MFRCTVLWLVTSVCQALQATLMSLGAKETYFNSFTALLPGSAMLPGFQCNHPRFGDISFSVAIDSTDTSQKLLTSRNSAANLCYHRVESSILPSYQLASVLLDQCSVFLAVAGAGVGDTRLRSKPLSDRVGNTKPLSYQMTLIHFPGSSLLRFEKEP